MPTRARRFSPPGVGDAGGQTSSPHPERVCWIQSLLLGGRPVGSPPRPHWLWGPEPTSLL